MTKVELIAAVAANAGLSKKDAEKAVNGTIAAITERYLGRYFPNTPMLAAIVKVSGVLDPDQFIADMEASFHHKFATKPQVIEGNMNCLIESMKEVRGL